MRKSILFACTAVLIQSTALNVGAALLDAGNVTIDTATGLQWLDVSFTANQSFNQVSAQLVQPGPLQGYQYATVQEVEQFFLDAGLSIGTSPSNAQPAIALLDLLGVPPLLGGGLLQAITGTAAGSASHYFAELSWVFPAPPNPVTGTAMPQAGFVNDSIPFQGSLLVRQIPEPSAFSLFLAYVFALAVMRAKRHGSAES